MFKPEKVKVIGISSDSVAKQKAFVEKQKLTVSCRAHAYQLAFDTTYYQYPVLSDEKGEAHKAFGVGKSLFGLSDGRVTFVVDGKGIVR